jgi:hypothetical protein
VIVTYLADIYNCDGAQHFCEAQMIDWFVFLLSEITNLVNDMHNCADKIIDLFSGKVGASEGQGSSSDGGGDDSLMTNPAKLCYIIKQALREGAVGRWSFSYSSLRGSQSCHCREIRNGVGHFSSLSL